MTSLRSTASASSSSHPILGDLDHFRQRTHNGRARLGRGRADRLRHRGGPRGTRWHWHRRERRVARPAVSPPRPGNPVPTPSAPATGLSSPSTIPTAICGSSRRSPLGSQAGSTPRKWHSRPRKTWRARFGAQRRPMSSTRSARGVRIFSTGRAKTRTGPPGMPPTCWRSRPGVICRRDRCRAHPGRGWCRGRGGAPSYSNPRSAGTRERRSSRILYNLDVLRGTWISDPAWQTCFNVAAGWSLLATDACVDSWLTDCRRRPAED